MFDGCRSSCPVHVEQAAANGRATVSLGRGRAEDLRVEGLVAFEGCHDGGRQGGRIARRDHGAKSLRVWAEDLRDTPRVGGDDRQTRGQGLDRHDAEGLLMTWMDEQGRGRHGSGHPGAIGGRVETDCAFEAVAKRGLAPALLDGFGRGPADEAERRGGPPLADQRQRGEQRVQTFVLLAVTDKEQLIGTPLTCPGQVDSSMSTALGTTITFAATSGSIVAISSASAWLTTIR